MKNPYPIIDLFAGPGGLGEGFSSAITDDGKPEYKIELSIEKDIFAHRTLELRAFYRQFSRKSIPKEYYDYLRGSITRDDLFYKYKYEGDFAKNEAWQAILGETPDEQVDERIKIALNNAPKWVLIGGPPCQAYSLAGRSRMRGPDEEKYESDPRHFLYKEYLRILAVHKPTVFIMENVKGLLSAKVHQQKTFDLILSDLRNPVVATGGNTAESLSYHLFSVSNKIKDNFSETKPEGYIVRSESYGIPQARHRLIILGIRSDVYNQNPEVLEKQVKVTVEDVLSDLPKLRSGLSKEIDNAKLWKELIEDISSKKWVGSLDANIFSKLNEATKNIDENLTRGKLFIPIIANPQKLKEWYFDVDLGGVCNHETRAHIRDDLYRYFFSAVFAIENGHSPTLEEFPDALLPNHKNIHDAINGSKFNDRFRVQVRNRPSTTIVSHISKDGHYYIHYDPTQCRSLTVREAARLQTFPDNYFFEGPRTEQYHQVGNAVPPLLAYQIAKIVAKVLDKTNLN